MRISYGKLRVPVHRVRGHDLFACEVDVEVLGSTFAPAYTEGDNAAVVATDTMKNFILRQALEDDGNTLEDFLAALGSRMLATYPVMERLRMSGRELRFDRAGAKLFSRSRDSYGTALVEIDPSGITAVRSGLEELWLLKVTGSAFSRFARDGYTTLPERGDRPLFVRLDVGWTYREPGARLAPARVREHVAATFDDFVSESIQHLVHEMGARLLADFGQLAAVEFRAENHTPDPVGEAAERRVFTAPFPAQGLITLELERGK